MGIWLEWSFDQYFTASIVQGFDSDKNGQFDARETQEVHDGAFINLENYGYFVYLRKGDQRRSAQKAESFSLRMENGKVVYRFYIPLKGAGYGEDFSVSVFDSTFFCAISYAKPDPIRIVQKGSGGSPAYEIAVNKKYPIYYDPLGTAEDTRTYDKWAPGLQTAHPEEVRVHFGK